MSKVIFLDVDGTLINYQAKTPKSAKKAIDMARENGHKVFICTGCSKYETSKRDLPTMDGMIGANGAYIEVDNKVIVHNCLSIDTVKVFIKWCNEKEIGFYLEANSGMYCNQNMLKQGVDTFIKYAHGKGEDDSSSRKIAEGFIKDITYLKDEELYKDDVNKISYILTSYDDYLECQKKFPLFTHNTWGGVGQDALFGDISLSNINKQQAIETVLGYLNVDKNESVAFGDANVDLAMFNACDFNVAMGNASDALKQKANYVTDDVDNDGLYKAFEYLELI